MKSWSRHWWSEAKISGWINIRDSIFRFERHKTTNFWISKCQRLKKFDWNDTRWQSSRLRICRKLKKLGSDDKKSQVTNLPETQKGLAQTTKIPGGEFGGDSKRFGSDDKKSQMANLPETQKVWLRRQKILDRLLPETKKVWLKQH